MRRARYAPWLFMSLAAALPNCSERHAPAASGAVVAAAVFREGHPVPGQRVIGHAADGHVTGVARTGAGGRASVAVPGGGMITLAHGTVVYQLLTVAPAPAGPVVAGVPDPDEDPAAVGEVRLSFPGPIEGAATYEASFGIGCPVASAPDPRAAQQLSIYRVCAPDGRFHVLARALDSGGRALAVSEADGAASPAAPVTVALGPWRRVTASIRFERPPGAIGAGSIEPLLWREGRAYPWSRAETGEKDGALEVPEGFAQALSVEVAFATGAAGKGAAVSRRERIEPVPERLTWSSDAFLPRFESVALERDGGGLAVRWRLAGRPAGDVDVLLLQLAWPPDTREHVWIAVLPPGASPPFRWPSLPDEMADWRVPTGPVAISAELLASPEVDGLVDFVAMNRERLADPPANGRAVRSSRWGEPIRW